MTNQQLQQITPDELSAKWSNLLNQAFIRIITLEKQLAAQATFIQEMTANEVELEAELSQISAEIATAGSAIIADGKEKAAP